MRDWAKSLTLTKRRLTHVIRGKSGFGDKNREKKLYAWGMAGTHMKINLMGLVTLTSGFEPPRVESKTAKAHCNFSLQSLSRSQLRVDRVEIDGADSARPRAHMLPI
ncbi:hypothetical protein [Thiolapillus sp.]|uniref:hypothetical protein n=1 Tax=Thiolapillus sp. TaxID=2017437 RepID=UPI003AF77051